MLCSSTTARGRVALPARSCALRRAAAARPACARPARASQQQREPARGRRAQPAEEAFAAPALWSSPAAALYLLAAADAANAAEAAEPGYSQNSYYATLFLFLISFPGLYSLVKRSTKSKIERKTFEVPGPAAAGALTLDEQAARLFAFFKRNNYAVTETGEVICFEGLVKPERGTAAYITFCAFVGLASGALVLSIAAPFIGDSAYWMTALSPAAGAYYWVNAGRKETMRVKIVTADDELTTDIIVEGDAEEITRCSRELGLVQKGMVYVKGLLETEKAA